MTRRNALRAAATLAATTLLDEQLTNRLAAHEAVVEQAVADKINHSACRWCYNSIPLEDLCRSGKEMGLRAIDLLEPTEWATAHKYGLECSMGFSQPKGFGITKGFNRKAHHATLVPWYEDLIPKAANAGVRKVICFSGNRDGLSDEKGLKACALGLQRLMKTAEKHGVTVCMELLNSKVDHKDYQCDHTAWGVELVKAVGSEHFKLLYDIYHMQIMEGDVIRTIREAHPYIAHYHTGGVPGRNEIDESQELYYPAIMRAIVETGHKGFVAQEFIPKNADKLRSLQNALKICSVE